MHELEFWGDCCNTFHEEEKQLVYAQRMGMVPGPREWPCFDARGRSVVDIGGGPASLLLKHVNFKQALVVDPLKWPPWVKARYKAHGVVLKQAKGEDFNCYGFDEAWIYNVLQHVDDPERVVSNARQAKVVRIFEWVDIEPYEGHPNKLTREDLDRWLGGQGFAVSVNERGAVGRCYYGVFV